METTYFNPYAANSVYNSLYTTVDQFKHSSEMHKFKNSTERVCNDIFLQNNRVKVSNQQPRQPTYIGKVKVRHYHHYAPSFWYPSPIIGDGGRSDRRDDNAALRLLVGIISGIVAGIAFYKVGANFSNCKEANQELSEIRDFKSQVKVYARSAFPEEKGYLNDVEKAVRLKEKIFNRIFNNSLWDLASTVSIAAAASLALVGAIFASSGLMVAGLVTGCVVGAAVLFKWGMDSTDKDHQRDAQALQQALARI